MNDFAKALSAFNEVDYALRRHMITTKVTAASMAEQERLEQALAQAGDVLERELRQMMREETATDDDGWNDPTTCSHPIARSGGLGKPDICERCGDEL